MIAVVNQYMAEGVWAIAALAGTCFAALYAGMETGIYVLNKIRLDLHAASGKSAARSLEKMIAKPSNLLVVLLVGTNLSSYLATFAVSAMFAIAGAGENTEWYTIAAATPLLFIFGESVPKNLFQQMGERLVYRFAWALRWSSRLFNACGLAPMVRGVAWVMMKLTPAGRAKTEQGTARSLASILAEGTASGVLTHFQSIMADRVAHITEVELGEVMVPMSQVLSVTEDVTREELYDLLAKHNFSRLLVVDKSGKVKGTLSIYDVLTDPTAVHPGQCVEQPVALPINTSVSDALYQMQRANCVMAVVMSTADKPAGIITMKDLVEEIVGELEEW